jgi:hypothetical protein
MKNKDQILLEQEYNNVLNNQNKSLLQKFIDSRPEKPNITLDETSKMKGEPIPIKNLQENNIYNILVTVYSEGFQSKGQGSLYKQKKEGYVCQKINSNYYKDFHPIFKLKGTSVGPGTQDYDINEYGDTQYGYNINVSVYESDITPEEYNNLKQKGIEAFNKYEQEYKERHGRDSSPWD